MARVPTLNALIAPTCIAVLVGLAWHPAAHGQSSSSGAATPVAADAAFGPWQPPPRPVPLAQATPADFDAAFVHGSFQSMDRPRLALLLASGGRKHDRVIELDDQGRWREFRQMTQFTPCAQGAFMSTADRRWFAWRPGTPPLALPAAIAHVAPCHGDIGVAMMHREAGSAPVTHWVALDGRQFATQPVFRTMPANKPPSNGWSLREERGAKGLVDAEGRWLTSRAPASAFELWSLTPALRAEALLAWQQGPQMIDRQGQPVRHLAPGDAPARWVDGLWVVTVGSNRVRLATADGRWLSGPTQGYAAFAPTEGLAAAPETNGTAWGYLDRSGQWALAPRFADAQPFEGGVATVQVNDAAGQTQSWLINRQGQRVEATAPEADHDLVEGLQRIGVNGRWGYADEQGRTVVAPRFAQAQAFSQGLAAVQVDGRWGFIDKRGSLAIPAVFDEVTPFGAGRPTWVKREGVAQLIDRQGKALVIANPPATDLRAFVDGRAAAQSAQGLWGFVDDQGRWAVPPVHEQVMDFENGFAWVKPRSTGERPCLTQAVGLLSNGQAVLQRCYRYALTDEQGRLLVPAVSP